MGPAPQGRLRIAQDEVLGMLVAVDLVPWGRLNLFTHAVDSQKLLQLVGKAEAFMVLMLRLNIPYGRRLLRNSNGEGSVSLLP